MRTMKNLLFGLTMLCSAIAFGEGIQFRNLTLDEAKEAASNEGKPIFIDCYTDWCGPCKWMSANMFTVDKIGEFYNENFICIKLDMEKGEGPDFAKKHNVRAYPTLLYIDADETVLMRAVGASQEVRSYIDFGETALDPKGNLPYLEANREQNMNDAEYMGNYMAKYEMADLLTPEVVNEFFGQYELNDLLEDDMWHMVNRYVTDVNSSVFQSLMENQESIIKAKGEEGEAFFEDNIINHLTQLRYAARRVENKAKYERELKKWLNTWPNKGLISFRMDLLDARLNRDQQLWRDIAYKGTQKYFWEDANMLNSIAWDFYETSKDPERLKAALTWANRAVELSPQHHIIDTQAHLLDANGNEKAAVETENRAIAIAQKEGADTKDYEAFVQEIKSRKK